MEYIPIEYTPTEWVNESETGDISDGAPAINADNLNKIETGIVMAADGINNLNNELNNKFNEFKTFLEGDTLWRNGNSEKSFAGKTLTKETDFSNYDLSNYKRFHIIFRVHISTNKYEFVEHIFTFKNTKGYFPCYCGDHVYGRYIEFKDTPEEGQSIVISSTVRDMEINSTYNNHAIPHEIIGYKY